MPPPEALVELAKVLRFGDRVDDGEALGRRQQLVEGACRDIGDGGDTSREEDARRVERAVVDANAFHLHALTRVTLSGGQVPTATIRPDGGGLGVHGVSKSSGAPTSIDELLPKKVHAARPLPTPRCKQNADEDRQEHGHDAAACSSVHGVKP